MALLCWLWPTSEAMTIFLGSVPAASLVPWNVCHKSSDLVSTQDRQHLIPWGQLFCWPVQRGGGLLFFFFYRNELTCALPFPVSRLYFWIAWTSISQGAMEGHFTAPGFEGDKSQVPFRHSSLTLRCPGGWTQENSRGAFTSGSREQHGRLLFNLAHLPWRNGAQSPGLKSIIFRLEAGGGWDS